MASCSDPACREAWVQRHAESDPALVASGIATVEEPTERLALVRIAFETAPGRISQLCPLLEAEASRDWCAQINSRPHLGELAVEDSEATAFVEVSLDRRGVMEEELRTLTLENPWTDLEAIPMEACVGVADPVHCQIEHASDLAGKGLPRAAVTSCAVIEDPGWTEECIFRAAEVASNSNTFQAARLCLVAGRFQGECYTHLAYKVAGRVPPAGKSPKPWRFTESRVRQVRKSLDDTSPRLGELFSERVFSIAAWRAVSWQAPLSGHLLQDAPEGAAPFIRGALAMALVQDERPGSLQAGVARLTAIEADSTPPELRKDPRTDPLAIWWSTDLPEETELPAIDFGHRSRRSTHPEPAIDRAIAVLEAIAQQESPDTAPIIEGLDHPEPLVRWTAIRLTRCLAPAHDVSALLEDPVPYVAARASRSCEEVGFAGIDPTRQERAEALLSQNPPR